MKNQITLLVVDDEQNTLNGLREILSEEGYNVLTSATAEDGLKLLQENEIHLVITDMKMPGMDGMEFSRTILKQSSDIQIIIITAFGTVKSAVEAMKNGVHNYITKPINVDELLITIEKAIEAKKLRLENIDLKSKIEAKYKFENIIGNSGPMIEIFEKTLKVAKTYSTVLIRGESGTGKELIARAIHDNSPRAGQPFVEINCSSFPDTLLESELFGYEKGAFTGAYKTKMGRFESANGGTIFLDEIGDINAAVQLNLLRVLQEKTISMLGSTSNIKVDVRVIAATNSNLEKAINDSRFREDLYYRLNVIPIVIPPLRKRKSDISLLVDHFVKKYSAENGKADMVFSREAEGMLMDYDWPGNVRELENAVENAVVMCEGDMINVEDLPLYLKSRSKIATKVDLLDEEWDYTKQIENSEKQ
ncbi:MAG: sigma-54-dependent Fis family transcriptional regulator, partial [bacterium]|nr:sigma-54-dependent Fis family transcriptional regulator [bacterium]